MQDETEEHAEEVESKSDPEAVTEFLPARARLRPRKDEEFRRCQQLRHRNRQYHEGNEVPWLVAHEYFHVIRHHHKENLPFFSITILQADPQRRQSGEPGNHSMFPVYAKTVQKMLRDCEENVKISQR